MPAAIAPIIKHIGGQDRKFGLLSVEDLCALTEVLPVADSERGLIDAAALYRWAGNVRGCAQVLLFSAVKFDPKLTLDAVESWGSIIQRCNLARLIIGTSLSNGEEPETDAASAANPTPETGGSKPPLSPTGAPDSATHGG